MHDDGHDVTAFLWDRECAYPTEEFRQGVRIRRLHLPAPYNRLSLALPMPFWLLAAYHATHGAEIVHACDLDTLPSALAAKAVRGCRVVYDVFDFYGHLITANLREGTRRRLIGLENSLASLVDIVLLPDASRTALLGSDFQRPVEIITNSPSEAVLDVQQGEGLVLFYGGNLAPDRGLLEAIEALRGLEDVTLLIAGTGELAAKVRSLAAREDHVSFLGQLDHAALLRETARAHVVLAWYDPAVPANRYASPNKLFEAMMLRRPIIVSEGTGMAEIVSEQGSGLVVRYGREDELREVVLRFRDDPSYGDRLGLRGRVAYERNYSWEIMAARLRKAYGEIVT